MDNSKYIRLYLEGTRQDDRVRPALNPASAPLDQKSAVDHFYYVRALGQYLQYYNEPDAPDGNWSGMLQAPELLNEVQRYFSDPDGFVPSPNTSQQLSQPHVALFIAFLKLLEHPRKLMNEVTGRHLDFYYREFLNLQQITAWPGSGYVTFELEAGTDDYLLPAGTELKAGTDKQGNPCLFSTSEDIAINRTQVGTISSIYLDEEPDLFNQIMTSEGIGGLMNRDVIRKKNTQSVYLRYPALVTASIQGKWGGFGLTQSQFQTLMELPPGKLLHLSEWQEQLEMLRLFIAMQNSDVPPDPNNATGTLLYRGQPLAMQSLTNDLLQPATPRYRWAARNFIRNVLFINESEALKLVAPGTTDNDCTAINNAARVRFASIKEPLLHRQLINNAYASPNATQVTTPWFPKKGQNGVAWKTFGASNDLPETMNAPEIWGLELQSDVLALSEGERNITLTFESDAKLFDEAGLNRLFQFLEVTDPEGTAWSPVTIQLSGEKAWVPVAPAQMHAAVAMPNAATGTLTLVLKLAADAPSICLPGKGFPAMPYTPTAPLLRIGLSPAFTDPLTRQVVRPWEVLCRLRVNKVTIGVSVSGLKQLHAWQNGKKLKTKAAFLPFGKHLKPGASLTITHPELATKPIDSLVPNLVWSGVPAANIGSNYNADDSSKNGYYSSYMQLQQVLHSIDNSHSIVDPGLTNTGYTASCAWNDAPDAQSINGAATAWFDKTDARNNCVPGNVLGTASIETRHPNPEHTSGAQLQTPEGWPRTFDFNWDSPWDFETQYQLARATLNAAMQVQRATIASQTAKVSMASQQVSKYGQQVAILANDKDKDGNVKDPTGLQKAQSNLTTAQSDMAAAQGVLNDARNKFQQLSGLRFQPGFVPKLKSFTLTYTSSVTLDFASYSDKNTEPDRAYYIHAFGAEQIPLQIGSPITFLPPLGHSGALCIGLTDTQPGETTCLLLHFASNGGDLEVHAPEVRWEYLSNDVWVPFPQHQQVEDYTNGMVETGLIKVRLPNDATSNNLRMPNGQYWIRCIVNKEAAIMPELVGIKAQAVPVERVVDPSDSTVKDFPIVPAGTMKALKNPVPQIKTVKQPYATGIGGSAETDAFYPTRVSERLRHRDRALTMWDCEKLVLQEFPDIYAARCIRGHRGSTVNPGDLTVVVLPNITDHTPINPYEPKAGIATLENIEQFLTERAAINAQIELRNASYLQVEFRGAVGFAEGFDIPHYHQQAAEELKRFLAPWAYGEASHLHFGGRLYISQVVDHLQSLPFVAFVAYPELVLRSNGNPVQLASFNKAGGRNFVEAGPFSLLTTATSHLVYPVTRDNIAQFTGDGIDYMMIEFDNHVSS